MPSPNLHASPVEMREPSLAPGNRTLADFGLIEDGCSACADLCRNVVAWRPPAIQTVIGVRIIAIPRGRYGISRISRAGASVPRLQTSLQASQFGHFTVTYLSKKLRRKLKHLRSTSDLNASQNAIRHPLYALVSAQTSLEGALRQSERSTLCCRLQCKMGAEAVAHWRRLPFTRATTDT